MSSQELEKLTSKEIQDYILLHETDDVQNLLLHTRKTSGLSFGLIADQIIGRRKISSKAPSLYKTKGIIYPPSINLEQCSSEVTAKFKTQILLKEFGCKNFQSVADISGGFGIDSYFLSRAATNLDFVEPNPYLIEIVKHNFDILKIKNITFHHMTAESFLNAPFRKFDFVFVDPSRRDNRAKKVFSLSDCQPDMTSLLPRLFEVAKDVLLKASPLLDLQQGLSELISVRKIIVVSVDNECKELLFILQDNFSREPTIETYNLDHQGKVKHSFSFSRSDEKITIAHFDEPQVYIYEPNSSILKSGAFKLIGEKFGLKKLHPNTHLYTSSVIKDDFPGRVFKIKDFAINSNDIPERKANVITRNYPLKTENLKRKLKLEDGGKNYIIAFSGMKKKYIVLATRLE
jgi:hypothetical protein